MSYYRNYRTRRFKDVFATKDDFVDYYETCGLPHKIDNSINTVYYLLMSKYADHVIASNSEDRFKLETMTTIFEYGPTWEKRMALQDSIRALTDAQILEGNTEIYNHAYNPETAPTTQTTSELGYINEQNVTKRTKNKLQAYGEVMMLLERDVTAEFLDKFKKLFNPFPPEVPIWYESEIFDEEDEQ